MNSTLASLSDLTGLHPYSHPSPLHWLRQDHLGAATLAVPPILRQARSRNGRPSPCRRFRRERRIRCASIDHAGRQKPIVPAIPKSLINYPNILSLFMKQRTYPRQTAPELSTNGHPTQFNGDWLWGGSGTADLSTALRFGRDDKGEEVGDWLWGWSGTADLSTALRFGRDDKGEEGLRKWRLVWGWSGTADLDWCKSPSHVSRSHLINRPAAQGKSVSPALGRVSSVVVFRFRVYEMASRLRL